MNSKRMTSTIILVITLSLTVGVGLIYAAGNIDATNKWAWGGNAGWFSANPTHGGVTVYDDHLEGYAWAENVGWVRLGTYSGGGIHTYVNTTASNYGVNNDGSGNLSGYAWSTNAGWINFKPTDGQVTIDPLTGEFDGYAWGENVGWIHFKNVAPAYSVVTAWRGTSNLYLAKTVSSPSAQPGDIVTFTITINSSYTRTAFITDTLVSGLSYVDLSITGGATYSNNQIHYSGLSSPNGEVIITYQARLAPTLAPGTILYGANIVADGFYHLNSQASVVIPDETFTHTLVLIYTSGDNNLAEYMLKLFNKAESVAANPYISVLVVLDGPDEDDAYLYRLDNNDADLFCPNYQNPTCDGRYQLGQTMWQWDENLGSQYSLAEFLRASHWVYPNAQNIDQVTLVLAGHGGGIIPNVLEPQPLDHGGQPGPSGLLWDNHPDPKSSLSVSDLGEVLDQFKQDTGTKIGLLYLDMCLMSMLEVAYQVRDNVDYLLASQSWSWTAFNYDEHLNEINGDLLPHEIGLAWLENEAELLGADYYPFTYSLLDLNRLEPVMAAVNTLADSLRVHTSSGSALEKMRQTRLATACFDSNQDGAIDNQDNYCDLVSFAREIQSRFAEDPAMVTAAQSVIDTVTQAVLQEEHGNGIPWAYATEEWRWTELGGLSLYLPLIHDEWKRRHYLANHFKVAQEGQWDEFLTAFWG